MDQTLFLIFFIYGMAFFGMGMAIALESWRVSSLAEARVLLPLAVFGLVHGTHEWFESYLLQAQFIGVPIPDWFSWLRLSLLVTSFVALALFAFRSLRVLRPSMPIGLKHGLQFSAAYVLFILASVIITYDHQPFEIRNLLDALTRYLLAVPASTMASLGLHYIGRRNSNPKRKIINWMNGAAAGFGLYALTQIFVPPIAMFPAHLLNTETFRAALGFPIQTVRTVAAAVIAICLLRATQVTEEERKAALQSAQQDRLNALMQQQELRRALLRHTIRAQEDERTRIARELHDETAQSLTAFSLELASLKNSLPRRSARAQTVERLLELNRDASQRIYRVITGLRPAQLDELGVCQAIRSLVDRDYTPNGYSITVEVTGAPHRLDPIVETVFYRVAQEALTNIARHAEVRGGRVELLFEADQVTLRVSDRGRGFDPGENFHPPRGWGLEGMKDRVDSVNGTLNIISAPGIGTTIEVCIPSQSGIKEQT